MNDLTGQFDICLQLSPAGARAIACALDALSPSEGPSSTPASRRVCAAEERSSLVEMMRQLVHDGAPTLNAFLSTTAKFHSLHCDLVDGQVTMFATVGEAPASELEIGSHAFIGEDEDFAMAMSREYVERVVRDEIGNVGIPDRFIVSARAPLGLGLVRWSVTVDLSSARAVLHPGGALGRRSKQIPEAAVVVLGGTALGSGVTADLDFRFELLIPFTPDVIDDGVTFSPCEPQFRLLGLPAVLEAFRTRIRTSVQEKVSALQEGIAPITFRLGPVVLAQRGEKHSFRPVVLRTQCAADAFEIHGQLKLYDA